ncbi:MAG: hypothetical protein ACRD1C_03850 [Terriglobales bacterium]
MISALVLMVGTLGAFTHWAVRTIVRQEMEPLQQDITVLRAAVFNHLMHDQKPEERDIREKLGYGERR